MYLCHFTIFGQKGTLCDNLVLALEVVTKRSRAPGETTSNSKPSMLQKPSIPFVRPGAQIRKVSDTDPAAEQALAGINPELIPDKLEKTSFYAAELARYIDNLPSDKPTPGSATKPMPDVRPCKPPENSTQQSTF